MKLKQQTKDLKDKVSSSKQELTELKRRFSKHRHRNPQDPICQEYEKAEQFSNPVARESAKLQALERWQEKENMKTTMKEKCKVVKSSSKTNVSGFEELQFIDCCEKYKLDAYGDNVD